MTAINLATDIPSGITTLEQLCAWSLLCLSNINPQLKVIEGTGYETRAAQAGIFYVDADNKHRLLGRCSLQVQGAYLAGGQKTWKFVNELSGTAIPAEFKAN